MNKISKNLKSPDQLFEEKRKQLLNTHEESQQIIESQEPIKKFLTPKKFFNNDNKVEEAEDFSGEIILEEFEDDSELEYFIENDVVLEDASETKKIFNEIFAIKNKISKINLSKSYDFQIEKLTNRLLHVEKKVRRQTEAKEFDPSDLYLNITLLKDKIDEIKSKIPVLPESFLTADNLNEIKEMIDGVRSAIPIIPEIKEYDEQLNDLLLEIENVKDNILKIPEIKYYDDELLQIENRLNHIQNSIPEIPEVKYYDDDLEGVKDELNSIRKSILELPKVKYYDEEIEEVNQKIQETKNSIPVVPPVKYYDNDIRIINEKINSVEKSIPSIPTIKYYDEDVKNLKNQINDVKQSIPKIPEVKYYDEQIDDLTSEIKEIFDRLSSIKIPDDDGYLEKIKDVYDTFEQKNSKLLKKINYLEEVFKTFNEKEILTETIITELPSTSTEDPLTPLDQNFVTLDQLQKHYKLFINRIQQQLSSIGGGGETQLKYLDDVVGIATNPSAYNNKFLKYNHSIGKFEFDTVSSGASNLQSLSDVDATNLNDGYLMIWNAAASKFVFVSPQTYFGINNDANPDPNVVDYGTY